MKRKAVSGIMLTLLFIGMVTFAFNVQPVKAAERRTWWTVDDDLQDYPDANFRKIQDAVDAAAAGDSILVYPGTYTENVDVNKSLTIKSENGADSTIVQAADSSGSVFDVTTDYVNINGFTVKGALGFCLESGVIGVMSEPAPEPPVPTYCNISNNKVICNETGIILSCSSYNILTNNDVSANSYWGIYVKMSNNNKFTGNTVNSSHWGVCLSSSSGNIFYDNNVIDNVYGISVDGSDSGNIIYHNNFINNTYQAEVSATYQHGVPEAARNLWDDGYPSGGNYWSDYNGTDSYSGPYQNLTGSDGIGDTPYLICENNTDHYPLMNPWTPLNPPVANFTWTPSIPKVGETVTFDASESYDPDGNITAYMWDFGDGKHAVGRTITHTYIIPGTYTITLNVTDNDGLWDIEQKQVQVERWTGIYNRGAAYNYAQKYWDKICSDGYFWEYPIGRPTPLPPGTIILGMEGCDGAHFMSCCIGREPSEHGGGLPVPSSAPPSYGEYMAMKLYSWLVQEGWAKEQPSVDNLKRGDVILYMRVAIDYSGSQMGLYLGDGKVAAHTPCVWGADWHLGGEWDEYHFIHIIVPPVARFTYNPSNPLVGEKVTFDASSSYDPDGRIVSYKWKFGDGTTANGRRVTHTYSQDGKYVVKLTVTDDNGNTNSLSKTITVLNRPPVARFTYSPSNPKVGQKITFDASTSKDPYGKIVSYKWNFGDGYTAKGKIVTHSYSKAGNYKVTLTVIDDDGKSSSTSKTVTVVKPTTDKRIDKAIDWALDWADGWPYPPKCDFHCPGAYANQYKGWCMCFVQDAYEYGAKAKIHRYGSAKEAWQALAPLKKGIPSRGAYVFYDVTSGPYAKYDHVGLSLGKGKMVHAHWTKGPVVAYYNKIGLKYIGWAWPPLKPPIKTSGLSVKTTCPVDLVVIDPDGLVISKEYSEIPEALYIEEDFNDDGSPDDYVFIPERKIGEYLITVIPEPDADPTATYTLEVSTEDATLLLAENVPISDIPTDPYILDSNTFDTPPVTTLTIGGPQYTDLLNNMYVSSRTPLNLTAEDNIGGSGVMSTSYRICNDTYDTGWLTYNEPFNLTEFADGAYFIDFNSTDYAGNVELTNTVTVILDNTGPLVALVNPPVGWALQDGVTFIISAIDDGSGVSSVNFSIREANGGEGKPVGFEDLPVTYNATTGKWTLFFDTLQLPDGYYVVLVEAEDNLGNIGSTIVPYSIRNWAVIELLPASETNKAGRTMPVKFSLRVAASVDPNQPFVYNEDLIIQIYDINDPSNILQNSTFGDTARDYRIDIADELYITNFKTSKTPTTYVVEVYRKEMLIGTFEFSTVK